MTLDRFSIRVGGPIMIFGFLVLAACGSAAYYLYREQAATASMLRENLQSRRIALQLETSVDDLLGMHRSGGDKTRVFNNRIENLIAEAESLADKVEEERLLNKVELSFAKYRKACQDPMTTPAQIASLIETEVLPACHELRLFNMRQTKKSEAVHYQRVHWMSWGLLGVGSAGALAGILLGYGVARGMRRSVHQLSVQINDASNRLGPESPVVTLVETGNLSELQEQMKRLLSKVEKVVVQLQEREREILRAEQLGAVGQLAAGAAHELRNPLTAIKMIIQACRQDSADGSLDAVDLQIVEQEIRRMERCLNTFLDFARLPKPELRRFDLASLVSTTFTLLNGRAERQRVTLRFAEPEESVVVEADQEQIRQVLVNLMLNAMDAMSDGGTLKVAIATYPDGQLSIFVRDTGPGIPPPMISRLFEPFVSSKETGLGLGLVVSHRIAEAHGGTLRAENRPEGGAAFELRMPITRSRAPLLVKANSLKD